MARHVKLNGYVTILDPARKGYRKYEHVAIAERVLGYPLPLDVQVHHFNENRSDNRHCNLVICENQAYHKLLHFRAKAYKETGNTESRKCCICHRWGLLDDSLRPIRAKDNWQKAHHVECHRKHQAELRALRGLRKMGSVR